MLSQSQLKAKFFDFLDENRLIFVVLSGRFQSLERYFGAFCFDRNNRSDQENRHHIRQRQSVLQHDYLTE